MKNPGVGRWHGILLCLPLVLHSLAIGNAMAQFHTVSDERWAVCPVEARPLYEVEARYLDGQRTPLPTEGAFPPPDSQPDKPGSAYRYLEGSSREGRYEAPWIFLDGVAVVQSGSYVGYAVDELPNPPTAELTSVVSFLRLWTDCSAEPFPQQIAALVSDFGLKWIFSKDDPFLVQATPLSVIRTDNVAYGKGALPFLVVDARKLSDSRVMVVIAEGAAVDENGSWLLPELPGSIWILDMTGQGWRLDAVFGGVHLRPTDWIEV